MEAATSDDDLAALAWKPFEAAGKVTARASTASALTIMADLLRVD